MAFNADNFIIKQADWSGLYKAGDTLERRRLRDEQQAQQKQARKHASAQFLQNYLDPKDYMSGTAYDPMIVKGLDEAMQQGAALAAQGVDTPTMMMALGPMVKKVSDYSTRAKTLNTTIDDQIKKMQQSDMTGYDYAALKREAMQSAMFDTDPQTGKATLNPQKADAGIDWISNVINDSPEKVTTNAAIDEFAKKSLMQKNAHDVQRYNMRGELDRQKYHTIGQSFLQPEFDPEGRPTGMVPKYQVAKDGDTPITHTFTDGAGKQTEAPVRLFDEVEFDALPGPVINRIKALTKQTIQNYKVDGKPIDMSHPKAKLVARAIAYDELNRRKQSTVEYAGIENKPSAAQVNLNIQQTPEYLNTERAKAQARAEGRQVVETDAEREKREKGNAGTAIGKIFNNDPEYMSSGYKPFTGTVKEYGTDKTTQLNKANVIDVTTAFPGGGLKSGRGEDHKFKSIYYDPQNRSLIIEKETGSGLKKKSENELISENKVGQFVREIAEANNIPLSKVRSILDEIGYKDQKFSKPGAAPAAPQAPAAPPPVNKLAEFAEKGDVARLKEFKGKSVGDDLTITDFEAIYNPMNSNNYRVFLKHSNGTKSKKEFKTKKELADYLKSAEAAKPQQPAATGKKPITKGILD